MATATKGTDTLTFAYNADGLRISKTMNGVVHNYYYAGDRLIRETYGNTTLDFFYDDSGLPYAMKQGSNIYYYITNVQGDVLALVDADGDAVAAYEYDPYGKIISSSGTLTDTNPLRYRGYVYDQETELYYLQSRYYDPETGRFVNGDKQLSMSFGIHGANVFSYCLNNPVNMVDPTGYKPGDYFSSIDEAARDAAIYIGRKSFRNGWEYATSVYSVQATVCMIYRKVAYDYDSDGTVRAVVHVNFIEVTITQYTYSAIRTDKDSRKVRIPLAPEGYELEAMIHTHPWGSGQGITTISDLDIMSAKEYNVPMYVYGPNGQLLKYYDIAGKDIILYDDLPISPNQPWLDEEN